MKTKKKKKSITIEPIRITISNLSDFLKSENPINTYYKSNFKVLSELEDKVLRIHNLDLPFFDEPIILIEYKDSGYCIFHFVIARFDSFGIKNYIFEYTGTES